MASGSFIDPVTNEIVTSGKKPSDTSFSGGQYGTLFDDYNLDPRMYFSADDLANLTDANGNPILSVPQEMSSENVVKAVKDLLSMTPVGKTVNAIGKVGKDLFAPGTQPTIDQALLDANTQAALNAIPITSQQNIANALAIANGTLETPPDLGSVPSWVNDAGNTSLADYATGNGGMGVNVPDFSGITVTGAPQYAPSDTSQISTSDYTAPPTETTVDPTTGDIVVTGAKPTTPTAPPPVVSPISMDGYTAPPTETTVDPTTGDIVVTGAKPKAPADSSQISFTPTVIPGSTATTIDPTTGEIVVPATKPPQPVTIPAITIPNYTTPPVNVSYTPPSSVQDLANTAPVPAPSSTSVNNAIGAALGAIPGTDSGSIYATPVTGTGTGAGTGTGTGAGTIPPLTYNADAFKNFNSASGDWQFPKEYTPLHQFDLPNYPTVNDLLYQGKGAQSPVGQSMLGTVPQSNMVNAALAAIAPQDSGSAVVDTASSDLQSGAGKARGGSVNNVIDSIIAYLHHFRR